MTTPPLTREQAAHARIAKLIAEYSRVPRGLDPETIYSMHVGTEREAHLTISDLKILLAHVVVPAPSAETERHELGVSRDPDGEPCLDIHLGRDETLSISVDQAGGIAWAATRPGSITSCGIGDTRFGMALWAFLHKIAAQSPDDEFHGDPALRNATAKETAGGETPRPGARMTKACDSAAADDARDAAPTTEAWRQVPPDIALMPQEADHEPLCRLATETAFSMERARRVYDSLWRALRDAAIRAGTA